MLMGVRILLSFMPGRAIFSGSSKDAQPATRPNSRATAHDRMVGGELSMKIVAFSPF